MPHCPHCESTLRQPKYGFNRSGSQRYKCRDCGRIFTINKKAKYLPTVKARAVAMYKYNLTGENDNKNMTCRLVAEAFGVSPQTVVNWVLKDREKEELERNALQVEEGIIEILFELEDMYKD